MLEICRRHLLLAGVATIALPRVAISAAAIPAAPVARKARVIDDFYGVKVPDDYRWMENPEDSDWLPFLKGQNAHTRSMLDSIPGRTAIARRISALSGDTAITRSVVPVAGMLLYEQRPLGADNFKLYVRGADGAVRTLIDPTAMRSGDSHVSLDWWLPSFDGSHVVYGLSPAGSEASTLHILQVADGKVLPERIADTDWGATAWLPDGSGFFYLKMTGKRGTPEFTVDKQLRLHRLGADPAKDAVVLQRGQHPAVPIEPLQTGIVQTAKGSNVALVSVRDVRSEFALWTVPLSELAQDKPAFRRVADFSDLVTDAALRGDDLYLLANRDRPRGRVLQTRASAPDLKGAREVLPQGSIVVESLHAARDAVYVRQMDGGVHRLSRLTDGGVVAVPLPFDGSLQDVSTSDVEDGAYLSLAGWLNPSGVWRVESSGQVTDTGITPRPAIDTSNYEARRAYAVAKDGVRIPYTIVARKGMVANGRNPVLATAYGAYQLSYTPRFNPAALAFLDLGGVYVYANVRGGGEYGREWHEAGKKATKANTWRDLIAVSEALVASKVTSPSQLAILGTSAGGITVGRAMTERPDLFAAVISDVGWSNPVRYRAEQNVGDIEEWGPMTDRASFQIMYDMDSYQAVKDGVRYPALLAITGATDPRVAPWHVTKLAARTQAATASGKPVLLRVDFDAGHGLGSTRTQRDALAADIYSFVMWQTAQPGWAPA